MCAIYLVQTPPIAMYVSTVLSKRASQATNNTWYSNTPTPGQYEVPPDGVMVVQFTAVVDASAYEDLPKVCVCHISQIGA